MSNERTLDEALDEIDRWGERVAQAIESLTPEEVVEYLSQAQSRLERRLGRPLKVTIAKEPAATAAEGQP